LFCVEPFCCCSVPSAGGKGLYRRIKFLEVWTSHWLELFKAYNSYIEFSDSKWNANFVTIATLNWIRLWC
jgi:hypothetical protein